MATLLSNRRDEQDIDRRSGENQQRMDHVMAGMEEGCVAVSVQNISKTFGGGRNWQLWKSTQRKPVTKALNGVSFDVQQNEIFGILGANGSGKSTLIRLMSTLLIADEGTISVFGHDVRTEETAVKQLINRVSVEASFFKKLSPMENLLYSSRLYGRSGNGLRQDIVEILTNLGIKEEKIGSPLEQMSRGMQQKVAIARAFLTSPVLLLLDEPTTGLDPRSKKEVQRFVRDLRQQHDATVLICSHDMDEAEQICDRIAIMDQGRLVAIGTVDQLKEQIRNQEQILNPTMEDVFISLTGHELPEDMQPLQAA